MYYIGTAVKSVVGIYNQINSATLTGAIDIIVIRQEDGSYCGTPFHVRFGKLGVLSSREKVVEIAVNDEEVNLQMKLGPAGEAFFVEESNAEVPVPSNLATSPIPSSNFLNELRFKAFKGSDDNLSNKDDELAADIVGIDPYSPDNERSTPSDDYQGIHYKRSMSDPVDIMQESNGNLLSTRKSLPIAMPSIRISRDVQLDHPLSDMDSPITSPLSRSPVKDSILRQISSDTELDSKPRSESIYDMTWEWGMLPKGKKKSKSPRQKTPSKAADTKEEDKTETVIGQNVHEEGLLLDEVLASDREVAQLYLNRASSFDDLPSGNARSSFDNVISPAKKIFSVDDIPKGIEKEALLESQNSNSSININIENNDLEIAQPQDVLKSVELSLCGGLKSRKIEPETFKDNLVPFDEFTRTPFMLSDPKLVIKVNESYYNWAVAAPFIMSCVVYGRPLPSPCLKQLHKHHMPKKRRGWFSWRTSGEEQESSDEDTNHLKIRKPVAIIDSDLDDIDSDTPNNSYHYTDVLSEFRKTLRLSSDQWESLNLNYGANKVTFTVTTRYQGMAQCAAHIYLWNYNDKIVISDIDGTITRSDVLGQMFPLVGKDWSQSGVTGLFSKIQQNGYHFMYLSARAIGQAQITRDFLKNLKQGDLKLPDGPVLLTPTSLLNAFKKEVIEKKPEEFKISCMRDVQNIFPADMNPFYSGFGNRINDVWAYRAVGIPISRIFTINYKGEIKHELTNAFSSSYSKLIELVDEMFPPVGSRKAIDAAQIDFTSFSFWRPPLQDISFAPDNANETFEFP